MTPLISIITVNLNDKTGLARTFDSIASQEFKNFEYIVIDGASKDGSVQYIKDNQILITKYISEKDRGIYDAMNKGIAMAEGEYCLFLNAGDSLLNPNSLSIIADHLKEDIVSFTVLYDFKSRRYESIPPEKISFGSFFIGGLHHQGTLIRRNLFTQHGAYDVAFKVAADWAFFVNAIFRFNASVRTLNIPVTLFDTKGVSSSKVGQLKNNHEREIFLKNTFPLHYDDYVFLNDKLISYLYRFPKVHKALTGILIIALVPARFSKRLKEHIFRR